LKKAAIYIDGNNTYHTFKRLGLDSYQFNFRQYIEDRLCSYKEVVVIKFYAARYPFSIDSEKHNRDDAYFKSLKKFQNIEVCEGHFLLKKVKKEKVPYEKGVDVRLATDLIFDAVYNLYDEAFVFSVDTDLLPAIRMVKKRFTDKKIYCVSLQKFVDTEKTYDSFIHIYQNAAKKYIDPKIFEPTSETLKSLQRKFPKK